ncbi:MAG: DUF3592 domain-containing protein [Thioalkalispiraceae bacterium]
MKKILPHLAILALIIVIFVALTSRSDSAVNLAWIALSLFGAYMATTSILYLIKNLRSKSWPKALYEIKHGKVREFTMEGKQQFSVVADLEYEVNGQRYSKDIRDDYNTIYFDSYEQAEAYLNARLNEKHATIFYNPANPAEAILKPGLDMRPVLATLVGCGLAYAGMASYLGVLQWK